MTCVNGRERWSRGRADGSSKRTVAGSIPAGGAANGQVKACFSLACVSIFAEHLCSARDQRRWSSSALRRSVKSAVVATSPAIDIAPSRADSRGRSQSNFVAERFVIVCLPRRGVSQFHDEVECPARAGRSLPRARDPTIAKRRRLSICGAEILSDGGPPRIQFRKASVT